MAEQEIDKLLLEIEVDDKTQGGSKKLVDDFATAVSKLNEQIAKLDVSKFETIAKAMSAMGTSGGGGVQSTKKVSAELKQANKELAELQKRYEDFKSSGVEGEALESIRQQLGIPEAEQRVAELQKQGGTAPQLPETSNQVEQFKEVTSLAEVYQQQLEIVNAKLEQGGFTQKEYLALKKQQLALEKQIANENEKQNKSFTTALKRVAVYRIIRGLLKTITNAFKEGFDNLAQYSEEVNNTLSQVTSSFTVMKNSVAVAFVPLLNALTPLLQTVSTGIASLANGISYLSAKLSGNSTFLKVNVDYLKKLNEQSTLLSFDTFEKLGSGIDYSKMFDEVKVSEAFNTSELVDIVTWVSELGAILVGFGGYEIFKILKTGTLKSSISSVGKALTSTKGTLVLIAAAVVFLADGIKAVKDSWNDVNIEDWEKGITIAAAAIAALATAIVACVMAAQGLKGIPAVLAMGAALTGVILKAGTEISKITQPKNYAFGGGYDSADLFYANENGRTELIASTNSGGGAVMNMQQLESAIYSGMIKAMASNSSNGESAVYLDGNKVGTFVASNSGFRNEANRRMTGLNWR